MTQDRQIREAVLAELLWDPSLSATRIEVTADNGVVTLTGQVPNYLQKHEAEKAATRVNGVKAVVQELEVRLNSAFQHSDQEVARAAVDRLAWDVSVPRDAIKVEVEKGWVTLTGQVSWHYQRDAAEQAIRSLQGVIGVTNRTTIKAPLNTSTIASDIGVALHRSWFDPQTITVTAQGGKVTLTGTVSTPGDRSTAGATAWAAPGTTDVENDLIVA